jgi:hypothetical protein
MRSLISSEMVNVQLPLPVAAGGGVGPGSEGATGSVPVGSTVLLEVTGGVPAAGVPAAGVPAGGVSASGGSAGGVGLPLVEVLPGVVGVGVTGLGTDGVVVGVVVGAPELSELPHAASNEQAVALSVRSCRFK